MTTLAAVKTILEPGRLRPLGRHTKAGCHPNDVWKPGTHGKRLIIILHQFGGRPDDLDSVTRAVQGTDDFRNSDVFVPALPLHYTSFHDPSQIVADLLEKIDNLFSERKHKSVILIGHSIGSLLARKLYIAASGEIEGCPLEPPLSGAKLKVWAPRVERMVLLAGMNRGWSISNHLGISTIILWSIGILVLRVLGAVRSVTKMRRDEPMIFKIRRGSPFITEMRLQWIAMRQRARSDNTPDEGGPHTYAEHGHSDGRGQGSESGGALTVQLLGSIDDLVSPDDNVDQVACREFRYLDVPYTKHTDIIFMDPERPNTDTGKEIVNARIDKFRAALTEGEPELENMAVQPFDLAFAEPDKDIKRVVFVIHGIRDLGYWTHKIARRVQQKAKEKGLKFATETSTYGYFAMLPFLMGRRRREKMEWLMERYTESRARYPEASISFVGHSNGTWLLAAALRRYRCCRFDHIAIAGSVVRTTFDWRRLLNGSPTPQVKKLCNFVATSDWVVALFPKSFQRIGILDLGSAGHDGFEREDSPKIKNIKYVKGGHSAAIREAMWDGIADFIVDGTFPEVPEETRAAHQSPFWHLVGRLAPLPLLVGLALLAYFGWLLGSGLTTDEWIRAGGFAVYLWTVYIVVTKV